MVKHRSGKHGEGLVKKLVRLPTYLPLRPGLRPAPAAKETPRPCTTIISAFCCSNIAPIRMRQSPLLALPRLRFAGGNTKRNRNPSFPFSPEQKPSSKPGGTNCLLQLAHRW
jgi:hypothetical protein